MNGVNFSRVEAQVLAARNEAPKQQLPLRRGHFGRVRMSKDDVNRYIATAKSVLKTALEKTQEDRQVGNVKYRSWKQLGRSHAGFKRLTKIDDNGRDVHYRLQGTVQASLHDLMEVLYADSTAQVIERRKFLSDDSLDAQTLCVLKERSKENMQEHISIRWEAINLSNNSPIYQRDMCYLEFTGVTTDADGRFVGFMIKQALDYVNCMSLKDSHGLARLELTEIMLLQPSKDSTSRIDITLDGVLRRPTKVPAWLINSYLGTTATCLSKLPLVVQERLLARLPMLSTWQFVPPSSRKKCHVCATRFGILSMKFNCRSCGDVACKSCIVTRTVGETTKFCTKCILKVSTEDAGAAAALAACPSECGSASFTTSTSSMGSCSHRDSEVPVSTSTTTTTTSSSQNKRRAMTDPRMRINTKVLENVEDCRRYGSLDEEVDETLDTKHMLRDARNFLPVFGDQSGGHSSRQKPRAAGAVEDSIAHQRYLIQEMLSQASNCHQQRTRV